MMVSAKIATCVPIEPSVAGPMRAKERAHVFIELAAAQSAAGRHGAARSPASRKYCRKPEISTPHAAAWPAVGKNAASASVAIIEILRKIDAAAALAKRCITLSMPP